MERINPTGHYRVQATFCYWLPRPLLAATATTGCCGYYWLLRPLLRCWLLAAGCWLLPLLLMCFTSGREDVWTKPGYNGRASLLCGTTRAGDVRPVANMRRMSLGMGGVIGREEG